MVEIEFAKLKTQFINADTEEKINLYITTKDLSQEQYRELLKVFPYSEIHRLEKALA